MTAPALDLDALERLLEEATQGPWCVDDHVVTKGDTPGQWHVYAQCEDDPPLATCFHGRAEADARLIAAAVNALPALIAAARELHEWDEHHCEKRITTRCPACGHQTLFIAVGGHLTCSWLKCPEPSPERAWKDTDLELEHVRGRAVTAEMRAEQEAARHSQTLAERDHYLDVADNLARAIVRLCVGEDALDEEVIGEHTSANDPWARALELAEQALADKHGGLQRAVEDVP